MPKLLVEKSPYVLDRVCEDKFKLVAITQKNVDFINAVVRLNSKYAKDVICNQPSSGFDPENAESKGYCGSIRFWFEKMQEDNADFKQCILGAIIAIDRSNSTHLNAAINGRSEMRDRICEHCQNYSDLIKALNVPFNARNQIHLISILTAKVDTKEGKYRHNLSFASKFCAYAAKYLHAKIQYSKYDHIVSSHLPQYANLYLGKNEDANTYVCRPQDGLLQRLMIYERYSATIQEILNKLAKKRFVVSKEEFDYVVWYANKDQRSYD